MTVISVPVSTVMKQLLLGGFFSPTQCENATIVFKIYTLFLVAGFLDQNKRGESKAYLVFRLVLKSNWSAHIGGRRSSLNDAG